MPLFGKIDKHRELLKANINKLGIPQNVFQEMMPNDTDSYFGKNYIKAHNITFYLHKDFYSLIDSTTTSPSDRTAVPLNLKRLQVEQQSMGEQLGKGGGGG